MGTAAAAVTGGAGRLAPRDGEDVEVDVLACTRLEGGAGAGWARRGRCWKETLREGAVDVIAGPHWSTRFSFRATLPVAKARDMLRWELRILPERARGRYVDVDGAAVVMLGGSLLQPKRNK